jgi:TolB-like protein
VSLLAELKRRNVFRMAGLYLVGAWLVVQVAETLLPAFDVPDWVLRAIILVLAIGFVPALVFSWIYELTPDGLRRDEGPGSEGSLASTTARRMDRLFFIGLALLVVLMVTDRLWPRPTGAPAPVAVATTDKATPAQDAAVADVSKAPVDRRSIAVLPFVSMSSDPENEYFADGISEELLNILAGIEGLKVASRTSAFSFKGKDTAIPEIARQLDVYHVLEGSVRKQGNRVRITAQLIEADTDTHLWTQTFQRDLDDIFLVQEEIAAAITTALEDILGTRPVKVEASTRDMAAYQRFLQGRSRFHRRFELDEAIEDLRFAVERDPAFAEAWAYLAGSYWLVGFTGYATSLDRSETRNLVGPAVDRALALKPDMAIALALKGRLIADSGQPGGVAEGIRLMERAAALPAPDTTPRLWLSLVWMELGYLERALPLLESARRLDPLVGINSGALGVAEAVEGRMASGIDLTLEAVRLDGLPVWATMLAINRLHAGDRAGAAELMSAMVPLFSDRFASDREVAEGLAAALRDPSLEQAQLDLAVQGMAGINLLGASLMFDRGGVAFDLIDQGKANTWVIINSAWLPAMRWLREDLRYFRLMQSRGRVEYWESYGYPRGCQPADSPEGRRLSCPEPP